MAAKKITKEVPVTSHQVEMFNQHIRNLELQIKDHRLEIIRLRQRNDSLQAALSQFVLMLRERQSKDTDYLRQNRILEGLFLAD